MVGDDAGNGHRQVAIAPIVQQIGQAVIELGDQDQHPVEILGIAQGPVHGEPLGDGLEPLAQAVNAVLPHEIEHHPHEETPGLGVVELVRLQYVAAALEHVRDTAATMPGRLGQIRVRT